MKNNIILWKMALYDLLMNDFLGVSLSDAKCMGEEYSNEACNAFLLTFALMKFMNELF